MIRDWYKHLLWFILLLLFILEGSLMPWFMPGWLIERQVMIEPHFVLIGIFYIGLYLNRHFALLLGLVFGVLHDIVFYGHVVGAFAFGMGLTSYLVGLLLRETHIAWYAGIGVIAGGLIAFDTIIYALYMLFQIVEFSPSWILLHQILPSLLFNTLIALACYWPILKFFERIEKYISEDTEVAYQTGKS